MQNKPGSLPPWESLAKRAVRERLGEIEGKRILDFGCGKGETSLRYAERNEVVGIDPIESETPARSLPYRRITGGEERLREFEDGTFDYVLVHNVLEYIDDKESAIKKLTRVLRRGGTLSVLKHNRPGRVFQMAVLLNDFDEANRILSGEDGNSKDFGAIRYYDDALLEAAAPELERVGTFGFRVFFDLQQDRKIQSDPVWLENMFRLEQRVATLEPYRSAAFFHHLIDRKK